MGYEGEMRQLARQLIRKHGDLAEVRCVSGHHPCHIELVFLHGEKIVVGEHSGGVDISMMKFGYHGTGSRCFHAFLDEAGFDVTFEQVVHMEKGTILRSSRKMCPACRGKGTIACDHCAARGYLNECEVCRGNKTISCSCKQGTIECPECKGTGRKSLVFGLLKPVCKKCSGRGSITHSQCGGKGVLTCPECAGNGVVDPCPECSAKGFTTCLTCSGSGRI